MYLSAADREMTLEPADLERLATTAYLAGEDARAATLWGRALCQAVSRAGPSRPKLLGPCVALLAAAGALKAARPAATC